MTEKCSSQSKGTSRRPAVLGLALVLGYGVGHIAGILGPRDDGDSSRMAAESGNVLAELSPATDVSTGSHTPSDPSAPNLESLEKAEQLKALAEYLEASRDRGVAWLIDSGFNPFGFMDWSASKLDMASVMDALISVDVGAALELASSSGHEARAPWMALFVSRLAAVGHPDKAIEWLSGMPAGWSEASSACELAGNLLPRKAEALAELIRDLTPGQDVGHNRMLRDALSRWADQDPEACLAWVEKIGPGLASWAMVPALEQIMTIDPERALSLAPQLAEDSRHFFVEKYEASNAEYDDPRQVLEAATGAPESHFKRGVVGRVLGSWLEDDPDAAIDWLRDQQSEEGLAVVLDQVSNQTMREKHWSELLGTPLGEALGMDPMKVILSQERDERIAAFESLPEQQRHDLAGDMAGLLARNDISEAAPWVDRLDGAPGVAATERLAAEWSKYDSYTASQWIGALPEGAPKDVAIKAMVESIARDNPDAAGAWLGQIADDSVRRGAVDGVLKAWVDLPEASRLILAKSEYLTDGDRELLLGSNR